MVVITGMKAEQDIPLHPEYGDPGFEFMVHGNRDICDYLVMVTRVKKKALDTGGFEQVYTDGRMGFFDGKWTGWDGKPVDPQPDVMMHVPIPENTPPYIVKILKGTKPGTIMHVLSDGSRREVKGAFAFPVFPVTIWRWIALKWNSLWFKECEHPWWAVDTRCMGEINHCIKCGKDL